MDRVEISHLAHSEHPVAAPVSEYRVRQLVGRLAETANSVVDLGCGRGQWLIAAVLARPGIRSVGVDTSVLALQEARALAEQHGLASVDWLEADAGGWGAGEFDAVICVGVSHVFGGLTGTLQAVRRLLRPGGQVILGDMIWEQPPSEAAQRAFDADADAFLDLHGLVQHVHSHRFEVADGTSAPSGNGTTTSWLGRELWCGGRSRNVRRLRLSERRRWTPPVSIVKPG